MPQFLLSLTLLELRLPGCSLLCESNALGAEQPCGLSPVPLPEPPSGLPVAAGVRLCYEQLGFCPPSQASSHPGPALQPGQGLQMSRETNVCYSS